MSGTLLLFAPGAGAPSTSPWMRAWAARLATLGEVVALDYDYMKAGKKPPDRLPRLIEAHRTALAEARAGHPERGRVVLCGKSMGSRVGCHLALEEPVAGLVCLGYPLVGVGKRAPVRDEVLLALETPVLFVQGTRDRLCPLDRLEQVRRRMRARSTLHVVEDGDHSLEITRRGARARGTTQQASDAAVVAAIAAFLASLP